MKSNSPRNTSLLGQSNLKSPEGARRRRINRTSSKEATHSAVTKLQHKLQSSDYHEDDSKLSWQNFKEKSANDTAEKFLWEANISSEIGRIDNHFLKVIIFNRIT